MYASHDSLRTDFEVSCEELDILVDIARAIGGEGGETAAHEGYEFGVRVTGIQGSPVYNCKLWNWNILEPGPMQQ